MHVKHKANGIVTDNICVDEFWEVSPKIHLVIHHDDAPYIYVRLTQFMNRGFSTSKSVSRSIIV